MPVFFGKKLESVAVDFYHTQEEVEALKGLDLDEFKTLYAAKVLFQGTIKVLIGKSPG